MSLLNDALEDLERRAPAPASDASAAEPNTAARSYAPRRATWLLGSLVACTFAGAALLGVLNWSALSTTPPAAATTSLPPVSSATPPARFDAAPRILPEEVAEAARATMATALTVPKSVRAVPTPPLPTQPAPVVALAVTPLPLAPPTASGLSDPSEPRGSSPVIRHVSERGVRRPLALGEPQPELAELNARARTLLERGDAAAAVELWVAASAEPEAGLKIQRNAVAQLMKRGALREARTLVRHVRAQGRVTSEWAGLEAQLALEAGDPSEALKILLALDPDQPRDADTLALEAALWSRHAEPDKAADAYRRAIALQPDRSQWWLGLAIASDRAGRTLGARAAYRRALRSQDLEDAPRSYAQRRLTELLERGLPMQGSAGGQP